MGGRILSRFFSPLLIFIGFLFWTSGAFARCEGLEEGGPLELCGAFTTAVFRDDCSSIVNPRTKPVCEALLNLSRGGVCKSLKEAKSSSLCLSIQKGLADENPGCKDFESNSILSADSQSAACHLGYSIRRNHFFFFRKREHYGTAQKIDTLVSTLLSASLSDEKKNKIKNLSLKLAFRLPRFLNKRDFSLEKIISFSTKAVDFLESNKGDLIRLGASSPVHLEKDQDIPKTIAGRELPCPLLILENGSIGLHLTWFRSLVQKQNKITYSKPLSGGRMQYTLLVDYEKGIEPSDFIRDDEAFFVFGTNHKLNDKNKLKMKQERTLNAHANHEVLARLSSEEVYSDPGILLDGFKTPVLIQKYYPFDLYHLSKILRKWDSFEGYSMEKITVDLGIALLKALQTLHSANLVHMDVKTENVLVSFNSEGLASFFLSDLEFLSAPASKSSSIRGTRTLLAPEYAKAGQLGFPVDIWGVGVTLLETKYDLHIKKEGTSHLKTRADVLKHFGVTLNSGEGAWLETEILRLLDTDPEKRLSVTQNLDIFEKARSDHQLDQQPGFAFPSDLSKQVFESL